MKIYEEKFKELVKPGVQFIQGEISDSKSETRQQITFDHGLEFGFRGCDRQREVGVEPVVYEMFVLPGGV